MRARVAAGLFERVSEWNGWGRILLTATTGVDADPAKPPGGHQASCILVAPLPRHCLCRIWLSDADAMRFWSS